MRSLDFSEITNVNVTGFTNKDSTPRDLCTMNFVNCPLGKGVKLTGRPKVIQRAHTDQIGRHNRIQRVYIKTALQIYTSI